MNKRFLITTALEETFPNDQPLLLLGEWCRPFSKKNQLDNLNVKLLPYHWDDRSKLHRDYLYLDKFYEKLLSELTFTLNDIHGTQHDKRYWRILIGPWLGYFVQIIFDRWSSLNNAIKEYELSGTNIKSFEEDLFIPHNSRHFAEFITSDEWNHFIYSYIIKNHTSINYTTKQGTFKIINERSVHQSKFENKIKEKIKDYINLILRFAQRDDDIFLINTYLSKKKEIFLSFKLNQIPLFYHHNFLDNLQIKVEKEKRKWKLSGNNNSKFEVFARSIIPKQIPSIYLEGYKLFNKKLSTLSWPSKPKTIFTSSSYHADDLFKLYAAKKTQQGTPLIIGQHGGGIGTHLFGFYEKHQLDISDLYFSWGWIDKSRPNIKSIGLIKGKKSAFIKHENKKIISLIAGAGPGHSYHIWSSPISATQWLDYFDDQCKFISALNPKIREVLNIRLKQVVKGWEPSYERWRDKFPKISIDNGNSNIEKVFDKSKICIVTYNATTFLETFSINTPTVIFWNPKHWELNESSKIYFNKLKKAGVFHDTPESAARHVNLIWQDVKSWWDSEIVQEAIKSFKDSYAYAPTKTIDKIYSQIRENIPMTKNKSKVTDYFKKNILYKNDFLYFIFYYFYNKFFYGYKKENKKLNLYETFKWLTLLDKKFVFVPTFPSSGIHYFSNVLNYYLNKKIFKRDFLNIDNKTFTIARKFKFNFTCSAGILLDRAHIFKKNFLNIFFVHTHDDKNEIPYFKKKLNFSNKAIFLIRDPFSTLYSYSKKKKLVKTFDFTDLENYVRFYNSYSDLILNKKSLIIYAHTLSSKDKYLEFKKILSYLLSDRPELISDEVIKESVDYFSFEKELLRSDKKSKKDFFKGLKNYEEYFSSQEKKFILNYLKNELRPEIYEIVMNKY